MKQLSADTKRIFKDLITVLSYKQNQEFYDQETFGKPSDCGTVCCLAGWIVFNERGEAFLNKLIKKDSPYQEDSPVLDYVKNLLTYEDGSALSDNMLGNIFYGANFWPYEFSTDYVSKSCASDRVAVAVNRIKHFLKTGE